MDKFDRQIITLLRQDARTSVSQIAREVNLSRSAVGERIRQLEEKMYQLARDLEFEAAAQLRDEIQKLRDRLLQV